jgi:predicted metalloprotease with PDZ domain
VLAAEEVLHTLSFPDNKEQIIIVRSVFPVSAPVTELVMPNWTPGSYLIRDMPPISTEFPRLPLTANH